MPSAVSRHLVTAIQKLFSRPPVRLAVGNFSWLVGDRMVRVAVGLVVSVAVARHLGPLDFGGLSFALAVTALFAAVAGLGLEDVLVRDSAANPTAGRAILARAMQLRLVGAALGYGAAVIGAMLWRSDAPELWAVVAICAASIFGSPVELVEAWFQAAMKVRAAVVGRQLAFWAATTCRLWLVWRGAPVKAIAATYVLEAAVVALALGLAYRRRVGGIHLERSSTDPRDRLRLLREGWGLMASGVLVLVAMQADRLLLGRLSGDAAAGIYAAGVRFSEVFQILPVALGAVVLPQLTALRVQDETLYWRRARQVFWTAGAAGLAIALPVSLGAALVIPQLLGPDYAESARVLTVHVWSLAFVFMVSMRSRLLVIAAATRWIFVLSLLTATLNVAGNLVLIPRYGPEGAAWAALGAWGFSALIAPLLFAPTRQLMRQLFACTVDREVRVA